MLPFCHCPTPSAPCFPGEVAFQGFKNLAGSLSPYNNVTLIVGFLISPSGFRVPWLSEELVGSQARKMVAWYVKARETRIFGSLATHIVNQ